MPSTRYWSSAWLDTSSTAVSCPARAAARDACRSGASAVVSVPVRVPITATRRPAAPRISRDISATEVLPLVPVTPITSRSSAGRPYTTAEIGPRRRRTSSTTTWTASISSGREVMTTGEPLATAAGAKSAPSTRVPGTAAKATPGPARRESRVHPSTRGEPARSAGSMISSRPGPAAAARSATATATVTAPPLQRSRHRRRSEPARRRRCCRRCCQRCCRRGRASPPGFRARGHPARGGRRCRTAGC